MILFDFDGTLVDSNGVWETVDNTFLARRGLTPTREYSETVGHSIFPVAARFTIDYYRLDTTPEAVMAEWTELGREAYLCQVPLKEGAKEFLDQCARQGEALVLLTACVPEFCTAALKRLDIAGYFSQVIFVQELGLLKKDPETYGKVLAPLGAAPADCTFYEDSPGACAAAKAAGLTVVGVYDPFYAHYEGQLRELCHRYIRSFTELL
ncbi:HAD family hydrolase [Pseudoflavonifractor phocaeensis]|uniref:HAD family hydrolase n=1 Tax=Pseudoflavonifractor phocaeensis TaxID=1870988 RepID=UPI001959C85D|nr:HAD family phosphatase [Pseudoflavonifractor phocaeensis]MBM6926440.1 HAD family phosphatase [Pseudoflavonifractor phocaeensis]